ncbi:MAG TPA: DUF2237 domain-containing protein [Thermodesulfobacteriota bacterium]|nr:DUF2237 domain-containing protein [Thermodesulfobacteriota bacterium]
MSNQKNVFGEDLQDCSLKPLTGFFRDGCCNTDATDLGLHVVCVEVSEQFLEFSRIKGNDLSTPNPDLQFPGLKPGDRWCLCALRWKEALDAGVAPPVILSSTNEVVLELISLEDLKKYAIDMI